MLLSKKFLSTPSARRATKTPRLWYTRGDISIHALREEGDLGATIDRLHRAIFLSTPSARRATARSRAQGGRLEISIHALREEGDPLGIGTISPIELISIHALREEGDRSTTFCTGTTGNFYPRPPRGGRPACTGVKASFLTFLSTPSARRATNFCTVSHYKHRISIHALREEGDRSSSARRTATSYFYPRPPRGGRQTAGEAMPLHLQISIHALREEGDTCRDQYDELQRLFLSTPSARRATAKTETKSLFSNKLYNILHEFRRALIYNGSKNYPNHAK